MLDTSVKFRLARRTSDSCGVLDVVDWKTRMADLQGIMSCAKALYLLLETHHEAIVRVALEFALEPEVHRIFAWENWYQESQRREGFRQKVQEKLQRVFRMLDIQVAAEQWPTPERDQEREQLVSIQRSRAKSREDKEVQADDGERARLEEQLEALLKERSQQIQQQELQKVQEVQRSPEREQDLKELEQLRQAKRQFEEQQREMEFLKEVQKRFEQQQLDVLRLEQAQRQSADQREELQKMRQAQAAFEKQSADLKKLREEHAATLHRANTLEAEQKQMQEEIHKKNTAMKEMQTKLQGFVRETEEIGAETEAVVKRLMKKVGLTDEVIRTELVWVRLYRDAMERLQRAAARREEKKQEAREKEREIREAQSPENAWEEFVGEAKAVHAAPPLGAWLPPGGRTPSASPKSRGTHAASPSSGGGSPKRRAFLEPETSQVQILQAPRRCVRKLQNSRSAPAIPR